MRGPVRLVDHPHTTLRRHCENVVPPTREVPVLRHIGLDNTSPSSPAGSLCFERLGPRAGNIHGLNITWIWREGRGDDLRDPTPSCQDCCQCILCSLALTLPLKSYRSPLPCQQTPSDEQHVCRTLHVCQAAKGQLGEGDGRETTLSPRNRRYLIHFFRQRGSKSVTFRLYLLE